MTLVRIQLRHDRAADWVPGTVLLAGEVGVETDTGKLKVGDGTRTWANLPYSGLTDLSGLADVATSGSYQDLSDKPTLGTAAASSAGDFATQQHSHVKSDINDLASSDLDLGGNKCLFSNIYQTEADLPSATEYHGMFAHVHETGLAYYAHNGEWVRLARSSDVSGSNGTESMLTLEDIDDRVAGLIVVGDGLVASYDDEGNALALAVDVPGEWFPAPVEPDDPDPEEPAPPVTTPDPLDVTLQVSGDINVGGESLTLTATVTGGLPSISYQWQVYSAAAAGWVDIPGETSSTFSLSSTSFADNDSQYRCVVSDGSSQAISEDVRLVWLEPDSPVQALTIDSDLPATAEVTRDSSGNYDLSDVLSVSASGGSGNYQYEWFAAELSGNAQYGFGRGVLRQVLQGETSSTLSSISNQNVIWLERAADNESLEVSIIFVHCVVTDVQDLFNQTGPKVTSRECRVTVYPPLAYISAQPTDGALANNGTASFSADFTGRSVVTWEYQDLTGAIDSVPSSLGTVSTTGIGGESFRSTLSLSGLTLGNVGYRFRIRLSAASGDESEVVSDWASLTGQAVLITQHPAPAVAVLYGAGANLEFDFAPKDGSETVSWEKRDDSASPWTTVPGATSTLLSLSSLTDTAEYRGVVQTSSGTERTEVSLVTVTIPSPDSGDPAFTQNLAPGAVYEGGNYIGEATSNLLAGQDAVDHYAVVEMSFADGRKEIRPLVNGLLTTKGPVKFFPANGGFVKYRVNTPIDSNVTIRILVTTTPEAISALSGAATGSPWATAPGEWPNSRRLHARDALEARVPFPQPPTVIGSASGAVTLSVSYPWPLFGWAASQSVDVSVQRQEPFYGSISSGVFIAPQCYSFRGAANSSGVVVAAPHTHPDATVMYSTDEGRVWSSAFLPFAAHAFDVVWFNNNFYILTVDPNDTLTCLKSPTGAQDTWTQTGWNFSGRTPGLNGFGTMVAHGNPYSSYQPVFSPRASRMSVANGVLYVSVNENLYVNSVDAQARAAVWRLPPGGQWARIALPGVPGVVSGTASYLVCGDCFSTNNGVSWALAPGGNQRPVTVPRSQSAFRSPPYVDRATGSWGNWEMREVNPSPISVYSISHNRPDDRYQYHYTPNPSLGPGARLSSLRQYLALEPKKVNLGRRRPRDPYVYEYYNISWGSFVGPPVGNYLYGLGYDPSTGDPILYKIDASQPNNPTGPEAVVTFSDVNQSLSGISFSDSQAQGPDVEPFSLQSATSSVYRGGYNYGPLETLDNRFLDGTWSTNSGPLIFSRNRVLALFRPVVDQGQLGSGLTPSGGNI